MRFPIVISFLTISLCSKAQGAIAHWPFDNNAADISGNNNNGILHGNIKAVTDRFGNPCGAYYFDGLSSYIEVPNSVSLESPSSSFSITVWYRFENNNNSNKWLTVACKGSTTTESSDNPQYRLQVQQNVASILNTCSPTVPSGSSTISINTEFTECDMNFQNHLFEMGKWCFYALVYDGQKVISYMNGGKVFEFNYTTPLTRNQGPLYIGVDEPGNIEYFEGSLDDLKIFHRPLNDQEILALFNEANNADWAKEEFEIAGPENQLVLLPKNSCEAVVNFKDPDIKNTGCGSISIKQISGLSSGSKFPEGRHRISYEAVSTSGYVQNYSFYISVKDITPPELFIPHDTIIYLSNGQNGVRYDYGQPYARDNCGIKSIEFVSGNKSNDIFQKGKYRIKYKATDIHENITEKEFLVEVKEEPIIVINKPINITTSPPSPVKRDTIEKFNTSSLSTVKSDSDSIAMYRDSAITNHDTVTTYMPDDFMQRAKNEQKILEVSSLQLKFTLYDNGVFDGDTVSIFLNQKVILFKEEVNTTGKIFTIMLDPAIDNELVMYAENLGKIPPNTALLIFYDGTKRYDINLLSTLETNGVIRIRKKR